ncbi:MAG: beta-N-acetylhexosaminidase [Bacteroidaceae bacterium]|nr:beta-N-acetylhexosaminidase [Bacteroidaceae bacterium]
MIEARRWHAAIAFLFVFAGTFAQGNLSALVPMPNSIETCKDGRTLQLNCKTAIKSSLSEEAFVIEELRRIVKRHTRLAPEIRNGQKRNIISIDIDESLPGKEHYTLDVNSKGIFIKGHDEGALFMALQTLDQIFCGDVKNTLQGRIEHISIDDEPRCPFRAVMIDPARHFIPVKDVKFFIDQMARFKFNVLQLHLTDDQGWRIEIKSRPSLTGTGSGNDYYTHEDIKEIVAYAAKRNIEVIPELDIPGHSVAILAAYPELGCPFRHNEKKELGKTTNMMLCARNDSVYKIYEDIIKEVSQLFPSKRIHIGGDEAAVKENWAKCDDCLAMMREAGYAKPSQLMMPFFGRMLDIVRRNGKEAIMWCELDNIRPPANDYLFPYPADVTLVTWRNALTPKCIELTRKNGHKLIMAPGEHAYLDYPQYPGDLPEFNNWGMPVTTLEQSYALDPGYGLPHGEQAHIQGVMATLWAEAIKDINRLTYMMFPRGMAIAEAGWSRMEQRSWESFKERIYPNIMDMMKSGVSVRVPFEIVERE